MQYKFSKSSLDQLLTCHPDLQKLFLEVIKHYDCTVLEGNRGEEKQHEDFLTGKSKVDWPNGKHNKLPSDAADVVPYPLDWELVTKEDRAAINEMYLFVGKVLGIAEMMEIPIRSGADWDGDGDITDQQLHDLPHFERIETN